MTKNAERRERFLKRNAKDICVREARILLGESPNAWSGAKSADPENHSGPQVMQIVVNRASKLEVRSAVIAALEATCG